MTIPIPNTRLSSILRDPEALALAPSSLLPAVEHAAVLAVEAEAEAARSGNLAMCAVRPAYPPLVSLLAAAVDSGMA